MTQPGRSDSVEIGRLAAETGGESGALERIRTSDPQLRKLVLYPLSYERVGTKFTRRRVAGVRTPPARVSQGRLGGQSP